MESFTFALKKQLNEKLPGSDAQKIMMPLGRKLQLPKPDAIPSAVNIIIFFEKNDLNFILIKRTNNLLHHSGQIALPGGQFDYQDKTLLNTAKRETYEEIGIMLDDENFIGKLTPLYINISNFFVQPFVSFIENKLNIKINKNEVETLYKVAVTKFFNENNIKKGIINTTKTKIIAPYFELENEKVWGATAMILSEFKAVLKKINFF